jgi:diguanylate cyclase (GGDEF)-like protein
LRKVEGWIGGELLHGAVYGLGMSVLVWILLNSDSLADGRWVLVCLGAGLAGVSRRWAGWPAPGALPWILAAWQIDGPAAAMLVGVIAALGSGLLGRTQGLGGRFAFDAGATALAVIAAEGMARRLDTGIEIGIVFAATLVLIQGGLHGLRRRFAGHRPRRLLRHGLFSVMIPGISVAAAWVLVWVWQRPEYRLWLALLPALRVGMILGTLATTWRARPPRSGAPPAPDRLRDKTAAALAQALPEGAPGGHLWRTQALSVALAERLGSDPDEIRLLSQASLLHHVGQLAYDDSSVEVHPRVVAKTVEQLGFAGEVRTILEHSRECWDGRGPRGLCGERICRGARILAVADRYDQLAHGRTCARNHSMTMALLRNESGGRHDPLMLEILDELSDRLEATAADLTRPPRVAGSNPDARLVRGELDLRTFYSIERATHLPIGWHERLTLVAGLLRSAVPFSQLRLERASGESFCYGDRLGGDEERSVSLIDDGRRVGLLRLSGDTLQTAHDEHLNRIAPLLAAMIGRDARARAAESLTDPATGLPNARFLRHALAQRIPATGHAAPGFGLIALQVRGLAALSERHGRDEADRYLVAIARRITSACGERETSVRLGPDQFIVLTGECRGGELVQRWNELVESVASEPVELDGREEAVRIDAAHAAHPLDGSDLETLLRTLESRLTGSTTARVVPFRRRHAG